MTSPAASRGPVSMPLSSGSPLAASAEPPEVSPAADPAVVLPDELVEGLPDAVPAFEAFPPQHIKAASAKGARLRNHSDTDEARAVTAQSPRHED